MNALSAIAFFLTVYISSGEITCPEEMGDCFCYPKSGNVRCVDATKFPNFKEKIHFKSITILNTSNTVLEKTTFGEALFDQINIENNTNLQTFEDGLFGQTNVKNITIKNNILLESLSLFKSINGLETINSLVITNNDNIREIAEGQFSTIKNLKKINLQKNQIVVIGAKAFKNLRFLEEIRLDGNRLSILYPNSLEVSSNPNIEVNINLNDNNQLTVDKLSKVFGSTNIKINLFLENMHLKDFREDIFKELLGKNNTIYLSGNSFDCSCGKVRWIIEGTKQLRNQIIHMRCTQKDAEIFRIEPEDICPTTQHPIDPSVPTEPTPRNEQSPDPSVPIELTPRNEQSPDPSIPTEPALRSEQPPDTSVPTEPTLRSEQPPDTSVPTEPTLRSEQPTDPPLPDEPVSRKE